MFGGSLFGAFDEDPFFSGHMQRMHDMDSMMNSMMGGVGLTAPGLPGGFPGMFARPQQPALMAPPVRNNMALEVANNSRHPTALARRGDPFNMFNSVHNMMNEVMSNMGRMQHSFETMRNDPNAHFYSSSSVMTISNGGGDGQPKVYQASSSVKQAPGGVRETTKTVRDSASGVQKMSHGRHIGDRAHVVSRERNHRTGSEEENQDYINLEEDDGDAFAAEFRERTNHYRPRGQSHQSIEHARSRYANAAPSDRRTSNPQRAIGYKDH